MTYLAMQASHLQTPQDVIRELQASIQRKKATCCIHTLGFSAEHDARFLNALTRAGSTEGTFHYISSSAEIAGTITTIKDLLNVSSFAPVMQLESYNGQAFATIPLTVRQAA